MKECSKMEGYKSNTQKSIVFLYTAAAAAAKSLQSCPTLCDPIDSSPPDSPIPGILQARTLEWVAISFSNAWKWKVKVKSLSRVWLLVTTWTAVHQAPPSMGFSRQEYWSGVPLPSPSYILVAQNAMKGNALLVHWLVLYTFTAKGRGLTPANWVAYPPPKKQNNPIYNSFRKHWKLWNIFNKRNLRIVYGKLQNTWKKLKTWINGRTSHVHGSEHS